MKSYIKEAATGTSHKCSSSVSLQEQCQQYYKTVNMLDIHNGNKMCSMLFHSTRRKLMYTHNYKHDLANNTGWEAKSIMGIQLSSKKKKLFLGTANTGEALTPPPQILTWTPMQTPHFKLFGLRKYFFNSVSHLTLHSLRM